MTPQACISEGEDSAESSSVAGTSSTTVTPQRFPEPALVTQRDFAATPETPLLLGPSFPFLPPFTPHSPSPPT